MIFWISTLVVLVVSVGLHLVGYPIQDILPAWAVWIWALSPVLITVLGLLLKRLKNKIK